MFTLWYAYLGYQEYRRRGLPLWAKLDIRNSSKRIMESASSTDQSEVSDVGFSAKQNEKRSSATMNTQLSTPELSTPTSSITVRTTVSDFSEEFERKMASNDTVGVSASMLSDKQKAQAKDNVSETGYMSDEDLSDDFLQLNAKDSRLLLAKKSSTGEGLTNSDKQINKCEKKKISFSDNEELNNENNSRSEETRNNGNLDHVMPVEPTRSTSGRVLGRMLVQGADEPMRCWMTEGDHPNHPAGPNMCTNIKVISNRARDSADSILRDSDEFIIGESRVTKQISWPKKVSISDEPPTTFIRDIPPAENPEPEQDTDQPIVKIKSEAELAAAAAAALKEDWRKKTDTKETTDLDEDDKIIFGDANVVEEGQILQISDDEASDSGPKEDVK